MRPPGTIEKTAQNCMRPLETMFGNNLNIYNLNGSFVLTAFFSVGIYIVYKSFRDKLEYILP